jgi:hypothetical protein
VDKGAEKETFVSKYFSSLLFAGTLALCLLVSGCSFSPDETASSPSASETVNTDTAQLTGYWKSSIGDGFEVNGTAFTQYDDAAKGVSFAGMVVNVRKAPFNMVYLTVQITDAGTWHKNIGDYYVIACQIVSASQLKESTPYKMGSSFNSGMSTRIDAENEYTIDKGYFGYFGEYNKQ